MDNLSGPFSETAAAPLDPKSCIVNYVWINRAPVQRKENDPLCGVPLHYLDKAFDNARKYPDTPFRLWLDFNLLDPPSRFFVTSHLYLSAPENVAIHDLNEIPAYRKTPLFQPDTLENIWARVDLARLMALQHCLDATDAQNVFYADFDVDDVMLDCPKAAYTLEKYGMFFGSVCKGGIENGYLSFRRGEGENFLKRTLIPKTMSAAKDGIKGFSPLYSTLCAYAAVKGLRDYKETLSDIRLKPMRYEIPEKPFYKACKIN